MNRNMEEKNLYVPPKLEVTQVVLGGSIALQSPLKSIELNDWNEVSHETDPDCNADVWLNI